MSERLEAEAAALREALHECYTLACQALDEDDADDVWPHIRRIRKAALAGRPTAAGADLLEGNGNA